MVDPLLASSSVGLLIAALLIVAVGMFIIDLFLTSDYLSIGAYAALAVASVLAFGPETWLGGALGFVALWAGLIVAHFFVVQTYLIPAAHRALAPSRRRDGAASVVGQIGEIVTSDGATAVRVGDELWPLARIDDHEPGARVRVVDLENGAVVVAPHASQRGD